MNFLWLLQKVLVWGTSKHQGITLASRILHYNHLGYGCLYIIAFSSVSENSHTSELQNDLSIPSLEVTYPIHTFWVNDFPCSQVRWVPWRVGKPSMKQPFGGKRQATRRANVELLGGTRGVSWMLPVPQKCEDMYDGIWWYYPLNQLMWVNLFKKTNVTFNSKCSRTESPLQCNNYVAFVTRGEPFSKSGEVSKCLQIYLEIRNQTTCSWVRKPNLSKSLQFLSKRIQKQYVFRFQSFLFNATSLKSSFKTQNPVPATKDPFMGRAFAWLGAGAMVVSGSANHHISTWVFPEILAGDFRIKTIFLRKHRGCKNSRIHPEGTVSVDWTVGCPLRSISWFSGTSPKPRPSD